MFLTSTRNYNPYDFIVRLLYAWALGNLWKLSTSSTKLSVLLFSFSFLLSLFFFLIVPLPRTLAVYPLDLRRRGRDISRRRNPSARIGDIKYGRGPDGRQTGSTVFSGRRGSYVEIPNRGNLDARYSITILIWLFHLGTSGPIVHFNPNGYGVHMWMTSQRELFVRFVRRGGAMTTPIRSKRLTYKAWNYVGASYDDRSGIGTLWINSRPVARRSLGKIRLSTNYPIRLGATKRSRTYFRGKLFCFQIYSVPLTQKQVFEAKKRCFLPGMWVLGVFVVAVNRLKFTFSIRIVSIMLKLGWDNLLLFFLKIKQEVKGLRPLNWLQILRSTASTCFLS